MKGTVLYGPRDIRFEERDLPKIIRQTDAIIRIAAGRAFTFQCFIQAAGQVQRR